MVDVRPVIILDLYDTLAWVDWPSVREGRVRLAELAGVEPGCFLECCDRTVAARSVAELGPPAEELGRLLERCGVTPQPAELAELVEFDRATWRQGVRLFDDALEGLRRLRRRGCRLAILSNCSWQGAEVVRALGLAREVDAVVLSFEVGLQKPEPALLRLVLERVGAAAPAAVLVDDLVENLDAAAAMGVRSLLVDRRGRSSGGDHRRVGSLAEVELALFPPD
jgi:putative hydrolase of the HAD superfamily